MMITGQTLSISPQIHPRDFGQTLARYCNNILHILKLATRATRDRRSVNISPPIPTSAYNIALILAKVAKHRRSRVNHSRYNYLQAQSPVWPKTIPIRLLTDG